MSSIIAKELIAAKRQLQKLFPGRLVHCSVTIDENDVIKYYATVIDADAGKYAPAYSWVSLNNVIKQLARHAKITAVEQYIRINHTHYCEICRQIYDYEFSVAEFHGESSFGIAHCCDRCHMDVLHGWMEQAEMDAKQTANGGAR